MLEPRRRLPDLAKEITNLHFPPEGYEHRTQENPDGIVHGHA